VSRSAPADAFGRAVEDYERGRPGWPPQAIEDAAARLALGRATEVLDLAAGTGKLTRLLVSRFDRVVAVEPDAAMRAKLEQLLPEAKALEGSAESIPIGDSSVDAVFVAEAFHWFDGKRALAEIARVLRPRGGLALLFNLSDGEVDPPLPKEARAAVQARLALGGEPGGPKVRSGRWREPFAASSFEPLQEETYANELVSDRAGLISHTLSISSIASLSEEERETLADELQRLLPEATYRDPFRTHVYWTRLVE
jgi:SAM-dependent methyltransferase